MTGRTPCRILELSVAATLVALPLLAQADVAPSMPERIEAYVKAEMTRQKVPGLAVAVVKDGKVVVAKGYGLSNVEHLVPVTPETVFQSGSLGKMFTAAAVMLLVEDGKLSLADSITRFYPDAPWRWRGITVRHLLSHTSGIPDYEDTTLDFRKDYTEEELARIAFGMKLEFEPGSRWSYSNTGYVLLGGIIRKASGRFYGDVLRERVFDPLGMGSATVISEENIVANRSAGYSRTKGELRNQEWVSPSLNTTADGGLYLSILDYLAWEAGIRTRKVLKPASWDAVFTPVKLQSGNTYPYGFGWSVDNFSGQRRQHHGGAWQGFQTYFSRHLGEDLTVIVLTNLSPSDPREIANGIAALFNPRLATPNEPIADREPAVTERARRILAVAREGKLTQAEFAYVRAGFFPGAAKAYEEMLKRAGELRQLDLLGVYVMGDDRVHRYRALFEKGTFKITLGLAPDEKVSAFAVQKIDPAQ
jgi:CubicO group peptidase (beta-lactamase class C family)